MVFFAENDGVVPAPNHRLGALRCGGHGHEVAGLDSLGPRRWEHRCISNGAQPPVAEHFAFSFSNA
jgi:hypothetical protein